MEYALTTEQIKLVKKMGFDRWNMALLTAEENKIFTQLVDMGTVEKVRGSQGWSAWRTVNFYDVMGSIESQERAAPAELPDMSYGGPNGIEELEAPTDATLGDELYERIPHECSNCGTRWQYPDYSSCPRCGYNPDNHSFKPAPKKDAFTPDSDHGTNSLNYIKVKLMCDAMDALLTRTARARILKATECGGFDAGLKALARVSAKLADERKVLSNAHAALLDMHDALEGAK
jgi:predicted  nucleic acid-binding Zn-ribbon protein